MNVLMEDELNSLLKSGLFKKIANNHKVFGMPTEEGITLGLTPATVYESSYEDVYYSVMVAELPL